MSVTTLGLFDPESTDDIPKVADMEVRRSSGREIEEFCRRYHYSGYAANQTWVYGLFVDVTPWGFAGYNLPTRTVCESVFGPEHGANHVAHLSRLTLPDKARRNSESRLIGGSLRLLHNDFPDLWAVLTYADPLESHIGTIYQATNALYTGTSTPMPRYVEPDGKVHGTYSGGFFSRSDAVAHGWTVVEGVGKHRYVYLLGTKQERRRRRDLLRLPVLPYPRRELAS